jgi:hypothetical protein
MCIPLGRNVSSLIQSLAHGAAGRIPANPGVLSDFNRHRMGPQCIAGRDGSLDFPDLKGAAANSVLVRMIELHAPDVLAGLLAAGVISSVMNSLDSQSLAIEVCSPRISSPLRISRPDERKATVLFGRILYCCALPPTQFHSYLTEASFVSGSGPSRDSQRCSL